MKRLTIHHHHVDRDDWESCGIACPKCARREVWREASCNLEGLFGGMFSSGRLHVCTLCKQVFRISLETEGARVRAMLKQLALRIATEDEDVKQAFLKAMRQIGVDVRQDE